MIFVDTSAWYALVVPTDPNHDSATAWLKANSPNLLTTDYVIDEILTLLKARGHHRRAHSLGDEFFKGQLVEIHFLTQAEIISSWQVFRQFSDKDWSFTDCTSKVVMDNRNVSSALVFDNDFRQFGSVMIVP